MKKIVFNGFIFAQKKTGVYRVAREILKEFDKIVYSERYELLIPEYAENIPDLKNIKITYYGKCRGVLWEQISLVQYLRKNNGIAVSFNNVMPILSPGIIFIHDICYKIHSEYYNTFRGKLSVLWHRLNFRLAYLYKIPIATVSFFSKYQLIDNYKINPNKITVVGCGWQHMNEFYSDSDVLEKYKLKEKSFFFTLGSIAINKNTSWIYKVAEKNPQYEFVIAGGKSNNDKLNMNIDNRNIKFLGYISDKEIKILMQKCKAFVFPSFYEGFGLPPLEALSQGAKIIISNTASLPEIYKNSAYYIDPYNAEVDLDSLMREDVDNPYNVLKNYSWKKSAKELKKFIEKNTR